MIVILLIYWTLPVLWHHACVWKYSDGHVRCNCCTTALTRSINGNRRRFHVFQIVSYECNCISKNHPTHRWVYLDHLEQFGISLKTFATIPRNVPQKIPCFPECVLFSLNMFPKDPRTHEGVYLTIWNSLESVLGLSKNSAECSVFSILFHFMWSIAPMILKLNQNK